MARARKRNGWAAGEAVGLGIAAGVVFGAAEMIAAALTGQSALMPLRMFASILEGRAALETLERGGVVAAALATHIVLSGFFGLLYGLAMGHRYRGTKGWAAHAAGGMSYGAILWLVNFQVVARSAFPWFLDVSQGLQLLLHVVFFGLPLGLLFAAVRSRRPVAAPRLQPA